MTTREKLDLISERLRQYRDGEVSPPSTQYTERGDLAAVKRVEVMHTSNGRGKPVENAQRG